MLDSPWNFISSRAMSEIFNYNINSSFQARELDPLKDKDMSELVWDVLQITYAAEHYLTGDMYEFEYRDQIEEFKKKWLKNKDS